MLNGVDALQCTTHASRDQSLLAAELRKMLNAGVGDVGEVTGLVKKEIHRPCLEVF